MRLPHPFYLSKDDLGREWVFCKNLDRLSFSKVRELIQFARSTDKQALAVVPKNRPQSLKLAKVCGFEVRSHYLSEEGPAWILRRTLPSASLY